MSLRLRTSVEAILAVTLVAAAAVLALFPAAADAQTSAPTEDGSAPSVVVRPGDSLWSISEGRLGPDATPQRVADAAERIHALNRGRIGADPDLIFVGQELSLPPALSERPAGATPAPKTGEAADAGERDRAAEGTTGGKATGKAPRTASGGAAAEGGDVPAPVAERGAERGTEREAEQGTEPVSLPGQAAVEPVPAARTAASSGTQAEGRRLLGLGLSLLALVVAAVAAWKPPLRRSALRGLALASNKLRPYAEHLGTAALVVLGLPVVVLVLTLLGPNEGPVPVDAPDAAAHLLRSDRRLLGLAVIAAVAILSTVGVMLLTLLVAALVAWKLPMRRTTRRDAERRGIPTGHYRHYHGAPPGAYRNGAPFAPVPAGTGDAPAAGGVPDASATASAAAPPRVRGPKARARAKAKASPRNGLALGAHNPGVRSASLLARAPARAPARARKPRPPSRAARPPLVSDPGQKRRGEQR